MTPRLKSYLRNIDDALLTQYLKTHSVDYSPLETGKDKERVDLILEQLDAQGEDFRNKVEAELKRPAELAHEAGAENMLSFISLYKPELVEGFGQAQGENGQALWLYLTDREIFDKAYTYHHVEQLPNRWVKSVRVKKEGFKGLAKNASKLAAGVSELYRKDGRGQQYHADAYIYQDKIIFEVSLNDYTKAPLQFSGGEMMPLPHRPAFQTYFTYFPDQLALEIIGRGKFAKIHELANIFNHTVLGDEEPLAEDDRLYNLNKILGASFEMAFEPIDNVKQAFLKKLVFRHKSRGLERITLEVQDGEYMREMLQMVAAHHMSLVDYNISEATFRMVFPGLGRTGSVTMTLSYPNRHNLSDKATHVKAKKYIKKWGLEYEQSTNQST